MLELEIVRREFTTAGETITAVPITPDARVVEYLPADPPCAVDYTPGMVPGAIPVRHAAGNVTETLRLAVPGCGPSALRAFVAELERALLWNEQGREDMRTVLRVRDPARHAEEVWYESRLVGGRVELESSAGHVLKLAVERFPYWDGPWERVNVTNHATVDAGYGDEEGWCDFALVRNADDAMPARDNWLALQPIAGDVPTPVRLRVQNDYNSGRLKTVRIGWYDRQQALTLEGENGAPAGIVSGTQYSNDAAARATAFRWVLPQQIYYDYAGPFRVLANGYLNGGTWRVATGYELTRMQYGTRAAVAGANGWTDLGQLNLPPGGYRTPTRYPLTLWLDGSTDGLLDYLVLLPLYQYRRLEFSAYNCVYQACLVDDPEEGAYYEFNGQKLPLINAWGDPIQIWPEGLLPFRTPPSRHQQMLALALTSDSGEAAADRSARVEVFARPRYRVLP